jgi:hypothetical protein
VALAKLSQFRHKITRGEQARCLFSLLFDQIDTGLPDFAEA